jgi:hypothetical protein
LDAFHLAWLAVHQGTCWWRPAAGDGLALRVSLGRLDILASARFAGSSEEGSVEKIKRRLYCGGAHILCSCVATVLATDLEALGWWVRYGFLTARQRWEAYFRWRVRVLIFGEGATNVRVCVS